MRVSGRWDGERLRGQAWWAPQPLAVFQPLLPPDWKLLLRDGGFYAQVAFSAAAGQGVEAGGHGVVKQGSAWTKDNQFNGVDFVLPFRFRDATWQLGTRGGAPANCGDPKPGAGAGHHRVAPGQLPVERGASAGAKRCQRVAARRQRPYAAAADAAAHARAAAPGEYLVKRADNRDQCQTGGAVGGD